MDSRDTTKADYPSDSALASAAWMLDCDVLHINIISQVEASSNGAYLDTGEPTILYERHLFHRYTKGKYDDIRETSLPPQYSLLSNNKPGGYGKLSYQHTKLRASVALDRDAAIKSCSWGLYQILGVNYDRCGYSSLQSFVNDMFLSVDGHLRAFVYFIHSDPALHTALQNGDWHTVGRLFNGRNYKSTGWYEKAMAAKNKLEKG